jgi:acyl-CoA hydrolase
MLNTLSQFRTVFPTHLNPNQTLFGGIAMQWMDETAYMLAIKHTGKTMVTVKADDIHFYLPVHCGDIVEIRCTVIKKGHVKLEILAEIFSDDIHTGDCHLAVSGRFVLGCTDNVK